MYRFIFLFFTTISCCSLAQDSFYFVEAQPQGGILTSIVNPSFYGVYKGEKGIQYEFNENGVFVIATQVASISRTLVRESSTYDVRNGFIFGVEKNDSVPCTLKDDRYYFGIRNKVQLVGEDSKHVLVRDSKNKNTYYINIEENMSYTPIQFNFKGRKLEVSNFDYEIGTSIFSNIKDQSKLDGEDIQIVLLKPLKEEFYSLIAKGIFSESNTFKK